MDSKHLYDYLIKIQSIAKIGLKYSKDPYALTNYKEINDLTMKMLEDFLQIEFDRPNYFSRDIYPTPSVSVRTIIFNEDRSKVLMVREVNTKTYSLPGGWADLYDSPSQTAKNECSQEAGADIDIKRLVGIISLTPFNSGVTVPEYVVVFEANIVGELHEHEYETDEVGFFPVDQLPELSPKHYNVQINRIIHAALENKTIFD